MSAIHLQCRFKETFYTFLAHLSLKYILCQLNPLLTINGPSLDFKLNVAQFCWSWFLDPAEPIPTLQLENGIHSQVEDMHLI